MLPGRHRQVGLESRIVAIPAGSASEGRHRPVWRQGGERGRAGHDQRAVGARSADVEHAVHLPPLLPRRGRGRGRDREKCEQGQEQERPAFWHRAESTRRPGFISTSLLKNP